MAKRKTNADRAKSGSKASAKGGAAKSEAVEAPAAEKRRSVGPFEFLQQVRNEGRKVTWTPRNEVVVSTVMVLIMVAFASIFFFLTDQVLRVAVGAILDLG